MPDPVFANIGKLLLANQIYEMHRIAHYVSGGLIVTLPGPDEDHNPETAAQLADVLRANPDVPYDKRIEAARLIEDLTASYQGGWYSVISLHGGGSPAAMKQEIWRNYPVGNKVELVERLLERGVLADAGRAITAEPAARQVLRHRLHAAERRRRWSRCRTPRAERTRVDERRATQIYAAFHRRSLDDRDAFWAEQARLDRLGAAVRRPSATTSRPPFARWFVGGTTNLCHNAVDRHLAARAAQRGADLRLDRDRAASASTASPSCTPRCSGWRRCCSSLGVGSGDRVLIYMPMIPEAVFAMLACARIGAIHSVVFGGFASVSLANRIDDAEPKRDRQRRRRQPRRQGHRLQAAARRGDPRSRKHQPAKVLLVDRGLAPMDARRRSRRGLRRAARAPSRRRRCRAPGSTRRTRATRSTPAERPAGRRACSATPAATRSRSRRA